MLNNKNNLIIGKCKECGALYNLPVYMCRECDGDEFERLILKGTGRILTKTTIRVPPLGFEDQVPYDVIVVESDEGIRMPARLVAQKDASLNIGDRVDFIKTEKGAHWFGGLIL